MADPESTDKGEEPKHEHELDLVIGGLATNQEITVTSQPQDAKDIGRSYKWWMSGCSKDRTTRPPSNNQLDDIHYWTGLRMPK